MKLNALKFLNCRVFGSGNYWAKFLGVERQILYGLMPHGLYFVHQSKKMVFLFGCLGQQEIVRKNIETGQKSYLGQILQAKSLSPMDLFNALYKLYQVVRAVL